VVSSRKKSLTLATPAECLPKGLVQRMGMGMASMTSVMTAVAHFLHLEFDQGVISRVHVLGLASFAKIEIWARSALKTNACDGRLLASIASDSVVDNGCVDRLSKLEEGMFRRMHRCGFALRTKVEIGTDSAIVSRSHDWKHVASIASHVAMGDALGRALLVLARRFTLKAKVERATREAPQRTEHGGERSQ